MTTNRTPRLGIGLPVYNGATYLAEALEALLGQSYEDFELIISDNASTDATEQICREFAARDSRIRYLRQARNIGAVPNHNLVFDECRSELFKWASDDDLYARDLVERCVAALDEHPDVVLAHSWTAEIDAADNVVQAIEYPLATASPYAPTRFRSMLFDDGGDDDYGVIRTAVLRRIPPYDSYHRSDRTFMTELALHGRFHQVPDWLYFRRHHTGSLDVSARTIREKSAAWDPRRASRLRHPTIRLVAEYMLGYLGAIARAPLPVGERIACYRHLARWMSSRAVRRARASRSGQQWASVVRGAPAADLADAEHRAGRPRSPTSCRVGSAARREHLPCPPTAGRLLRSARPGQPRQRRLAGVGAGLPPVAASRHGDRLPVPAPRRRDTALRGARDPSALEPPRVRDRGRRAGAGGQGARKAGRPVPDRRVGPRPRTRHRPRHGCAGVGAAAAPLGLPLLAVPALHHRRLQRRKVALISVGADRSISPATRWLVGRSARAAAYRSFRDAPSREAMRSMGVDTSRDGIYPDLVFALPHPAAPEAPTGVVGLGVMDYHGGYGDRGRARRSARRLRRQPSPASPTG